MEAATATAWQDLPSGVVIPTAPTLKVIDGGKTVRPRRKSPSRVMTQRSRFNPDSCREVPDGFHQCPYGPCKRLIPSHKFERRIVTCEDGHETDLDEEIRREHEDPGGIALVGLTNTQQGFIAESVVAAFTPLGSYGTPGDFTDYCCPVDFVTDAGVAIEVKSVSTRARNHAFALTAKKKERIAAYMKQHECTGLVGALVILDFSSATADVYLREMPNGAIYFEKPKVAFATEVPFDSPFNAAPTSTEDIPF